jgi:hypothetical protein
MIVVEDINDSSGSIMISSQSCICCGGVATMVMKYGPKNQLTHVSMCPFCQINMISELERNMKDNNIEPYPMEEDPHSIVTDNGYGAREGLYDLRKKQADLELFADASEFDEDQPEPEDENNSTFNHDDTVPSTDDGKTILCD